MSRTDEYWKSEEFDLKNFRNLRRLTHNSEVVDELFGDEFITYHANMKLPCYKYDLYHKHCINQNGYMTKEYLQSRACQKTRKWFEDCVQNVQNTNLFKKYNPEEFVVNREAFPIYNIKDVIQLQ